MAHEMGIFEGSIRGSVNCFVLKIIVIRWRNN